MDFRLLCNSDIYVSIWWAPNSHETTSKCRTTHLLSLGNVSFLEWISHVYPPSSGWVNRNLDINHIFGNSWSVGCIVNSKGCNKWCWSFNTMNISYACGCIFSTQHSLGKTSFNYIVELWLSSWSCNFWSSTNHRIYLMWSNFFF